MVVAFVMIVIVVVKAEVVVVVVIVVVVASLVVEEVASSSRNKSGSSSISIGGSSSICISDTYIHVGILLRINSIITFYISSSLNSACIIFIICIVSTFTSYHLSTVKSAFICISHSFIHVGILLRSLEGHLDQINSITLWEGYQMLLISGIVMMNWMTMIVMGMRMRMMRILMMIIMMMSSGFEYFS